MSTPTRTPAANIADRLAHMAADAPDRPAIFTPTGRDRSGNRTYRRLTFAELDEAARRIAAGLQQQGIRPGTRLALFVPFSEEFIVLTFALLRAGVVAVLIDPGMGRKHILRCLQEVQPEGFVAIPFVHLIHWLNRRHFPKAKWNISVGRRFPGTVATYEGLRQADLSDFQAPVTQAPVTQATDPAAIIFTSGSTGPPKGVLYEHGMFDAQVTMIRDYYGIQPGDVDLPGFPLFGLFNAAMGVTTVIPQMNPTRPAQVNPANIVEHLSDHQVTQAFGSPAFWNRVGRHCEANGIQLPTLARALSAGGPVPNHVLQRMTKAMPHPQAAFHTPYGATESLPVASISAAEVLQHTATQSRQGMGTCVGQPFPDVEVRILPITTGAIASLSEISPLPQGEIGEIIVSGPSVTKEYFQRPERTALSKIPDGSRTWHRIGDVGYLDDSGRLWFCGRKAHIVECEGQRMFSVCCEAIINEDPRIYRSALVGVPSNAGTQAVIVAEPEPRAFPKTRRQQHRLLAELLQRAHRHPLTRPVSRILLHRSLPVDTRHNVKINREALAEWAAKQF